MTSRRQILKLGAASVVSAIVPVIVEAKATKVLFVHGRDQQGQDPVRLKQAWLDALNRGASAAGKSLPSGIDVAFPYYGDTLDGFTRDIPLTSQVRTRGDAAQDQFLEFQAQVAEEVRQRAGVTDAEVDMEYGANQRPKGPLNWEWVQAILRAIDKHGGGLNQTTLEIVTRDVFLYTNRVGVRDEINGIVAGALTTEPTVVVGHSLGSVVAYDVLRTDPRSLQVPLYVTVGSPLGVRAIREQFKPLRSPSAVQAWYNAFDERDVVALYALDATNFPVQPAIVNYGRVANATSNRHGISGYLDDANVAGRILDTLG
jgi:hypothetical protein